MGCIVLLFLIFLVLGFGFQGAALGTLIALAIIILWNLDLLGDFLGCCLCLVAIAAIVVFLLLGWLMPNDYL